VTEDCLKLTIYYGERDRTGGSFLADALAATFARHELQTSLVIRGVEGFGIKHHLRTDRLLSLSEDLPLVSVAVDTRARIERALAEVNELRFDGLITLERATMLAGPNGRSGSVFDRDEEVKLTVYVGRHERLGGRLAYEAVIDLLKRRRVAGGTVLLGVDGTRHGVRERARFFAANVHVPLMVIAVGHSRQIEGLLPELDGMLARPLITLERVRICKRDGQRLGEPDQLPDTDASGLGVWQKLMIYAGEQARSNGHPLHHRVIRALREGGAAGATTLRGIWGYHGDHAPHGDSFWQLRRRVPLVTVVIDTPQRTQRWFQIVDRLTTETGLVTSEIVPAFRATGPQVRSGGLRLARLREHKGA
jgi:PII-like signaling protein